MDYKYFRGQAVPSFNGKQRPLVEWLLKTARASDDKKISTSEFVYDFGIPRISAVIFNLPFLLSAVLVVLRLSPLINNPE